MTDTLRKLGRDRFSSLVNKAMNATSKEEKDKNMAEANRLAEYVFHAYGINDFAFITGAR